MRREEGTVAEVVCLGLLQRGKSVVDQDVAVLRGGLGTNTMDKLLARAAA